MSNNIEYIINDWYTGLNAQYIAQRCGLIQRVYDYFFIKRIVFRSDSKLYINSFINGEVEKKVIEPNQWVYAFKANEKVIVITKPLPFNKKVEEASHRLRVKHNNF